MDTKDMSTFKKESAGEPALRDGKGASRKRLEQDEEDPQMLELRLFSEIKWSNRPPSNPSASTGDSTRDAVELKKKTCGWRLGSIRG
ncbi:unnamed protein product [Bursaphelenchus xylophilus]|uniref:(pine wood nematode) hypothetical protein n=1 Tax=Bursaphelenchus xylophilus TaxID=6326 RepID=A0A811L0H8_BURXY|nr:unnamed protein product [Bursaphelenchus xylophilus]CAG9107417.1 unnamed protein product [Bursaphelenchus xylophilus]